MNHETANHIISAILRKPKPEPRSQHPFRRVVSREVFQFGGGKRAVLTMECGHTAEAIHIDDQEVICLSCP